MDCGLLYDCWFGSGMDGGVMEGRWEGGIYQLVGFV
jgi:hypothetical protein